MSTAQTLPSWMARLHSWARAQPWLWRFTLMNRILLALAFLPTGLVKATGHRFTTIPATEPVGFFFEAMYRTGPYWHFIGFAQIAAAIMLLVPYTATVGALLFLPISVSIFLITWGVGFGNTVYVTAGMLLSVTYLVCWDADRVWAAGVQVFGRARGPGLLEGAHVVEKLGWLLGGVAGMGLLLTTRGFVPIALRLELLYMGVAAAALVVAGWIVGGWSARSAPRTT